MPFCCSCSASEYEDNHQSDNYPTVNLHPQELKQAQDALLKGALFYKFGSNGGRKEKYLNLDRDRTRLTYTPSNKPVKDTTIYIKDIVEIRDRTQDSTVPDTKIFHKAAKETKDMFCFAIIHRYTTTGGENRRRYKSFNMGFGTEKEKSKFMQTIAFLAMRTRRDYTRDPQAMRMLELWMEADKDADKRLSLKEISELLQKLNVQLDRQMLREKFNAADMDQSGYLKFDEFKHFYDQLTRRKEVLPLFRGYAKEHGKAAGKESEVMSARELAEFCRCCQGEGLEPEQARQLIQGIADPKAKGITLSQFTNYLFNRNMNSWWKPQHRLKVYQDMSQPLHHYFVSSSHNTYLVGDQLKSRSSTEMYKIVLERGCRCVELDCHDGGDGEPVIYHGHTRTSKIRFDAVCKVINEYAFKTSEYPVILSLEVHCKKHGQQVMAKHMKDIFKERVRDKDGQDRWLSRMCVLDGRFLSQTPEEPLPDYTPKALKRKILVKAKMHPEHYLQVQGSPQGGDEDSEEEKEESEEVLKERRRAAQVGKPAPKEPVCKELSSCVFLRSTRMDRGSGPAEWAQRNRPHEIASYSEGASKDLSRAMVPHSQLHAFVEANKRMLSRVYPAGTRVRSDNYMPQQHWNSGCSLVALNWQKLDFPMRLNEAKFEQNGRCGYVLKPHQLRCPNVEPRYTQEMELTVRVMSGSQIPKPNLQGRGEIIDPYVALWLNGVPEDTVGGGDKWRTDAIINNGFNPVWNEKNEFTFHITAVDMAMLTLRVIDADKAGRDNPIAEATIPVASLRLGYRCVPLRAVINNELIDHACLFCFFALRGVGGRQ
eukprot:TRINITY_DN16943_c0_g1_i1.p1 TRINITY_DN16943_c0_g1~~TRINITY_DN16943_c0_g1_i1.p1  ORF type:complete len:852 (+),score=257.87 TRINITY_DN16943_c0_g1_i1:92-2557(+)